MVPLPRPDHRNKRPLHLVVILEKVAAANIKKRARANIKV